MRGVGVTQALTDALPEWGVPVMAAVTTVGDPVVLLVAVTLVYWIGPRFDVVDSQSGLRLFAVTITTLAVVATLKQYFGLPRPPSPGIAYSTGGYGFPSGHATAAAAVYGSGAALSRFSTARRRGGIAGTVILVVGMSRLALGVHYLIDVIAGVGVGLLISAVVLTATRSRTAPGFWIGTGTGVAAAIVTGLAPAAVMTSDAAVALGGTVGGLLTWTGIEETDSTVVPPSYPVVGLGVLVLGTPLLLVNVARLSVPVTVGAAAIASAVAVGLPALRTFRGNGRVPTD